MTKKDKKPESINQADLTLKLEQDLEKANQSIEELTNAYKRVMADLQNFKRRTEEDQKGLVSFANVRLILEILPVLDNFERAMQHKPEDLKGDWIDGVSQIYQHFKSILEKQGVEEIKTIGEKYDANLHEAMLHSSGEDGIIIQEFEKGYILKGKVIRPAKVSVGNGTK